MVASAQPLPSRIKRPDVASQWQLMWWRFRRHHMAMLGMAMLAAFTFVAVFAEFLAPYDPGKRNPRYLAGAPTPIHLFDSQGGFHATPFVYARTAKRDPVTLRQVPAVDEGRQWPVRFFVRGDTYLFFGLFESDLHLFGAPDGFVHLFGTDHLGRDMFSRTMYATRVSLSVALVGVTVSFILGAIIGGVAGYFGGAVDMFVMRLIEFIRSVPTLPLWLALTAALPRDWTSLQIYIAVTTILGLLGWTHLARTVRSKLLALREEDFVIAAKLAGCTDARLIGRHLLPSFLSYLIVDLTISFPEVLLAETALSFLGLGLREPIESWGVLLYAAQNIRSIAHMPWLLIPGLFVIVSALAFNFVGDGMRDAADPYAR